MSYCFGPKTKGRTRTVVCVKKGNAKWGALRCLFTQASSKASSFYVQGQAQPCLS